MRFDRLSEEGQGTGIGTKYWLDLRFIREHRGIEIDTVHERTRVPIEVLSSFEQCGFPDRKRFNSVYRRSLVAAYARAIDINPDDALRSAEETEIGRYRGRLALEYLGLEPEDVQEPPQKTGDRQSVKTSRRDAPRRGDETRDDAGGATDSSRWSLRGNVSPRTLTIVVVITVVVVVFWLFTVLR